MAKNENGDYPTPLSAILPMIQNISFHGNPSFLEPCKGAGNIYNLIPVGSKFYCELNPTYTTFEEHAAPQPKPFLGYDYLKTVCPTVDIIMTNPDFSVWREFLTKSLSEAETVIYLLRLNTMGSGKTSGRAKWWNENRPTHVFALEDRPSFVATCKRNGRRGCDKTYPSGTKGICECGGSITDTTDGTDYAWFCWDRGNRIKTKEPFNWIGAEQTDF